MAREPTAAHTHERVDILAAAAFPLCRELRHFPKGCTRKALYPKQTCFWVPLPKHFVGFPRWSQRGWSRRNAPSCRSVGQGIGEILLRRSKWFERVKHPLTSMNMASTPWIFTETADPRSLCFTWLNEPLELCLTVNPSGTQALTKPQPSSTRTQYRGKESSSLSLYCLLHSWTITFKQTHKVRSSYGGNFRTVF